MLADGTPTAVFAEAALATMLTYASATTILAAVTHTVMRADAAPAALLALIALAAMLTDAGPTTILAVIPHAAMLADTTPAALLADVALATMLADAGSAALLAAAAPAAMWASATLGYAHNTHRGSGINWRRPPALYACHRCICRGGGRGGCATNTG